MKYELIVEHEGTRDSVMDFAKEIHSEFGCDVIINQISDEGRVIEPLIPWKPSKPRKRVKAHKRG